MRFSGLVLKGWEESSAKNRHVCSETLSCLGGGIAESHVHPLIRSLQHLLYLGKLHIFSLSGFSAGA